ncbi:MAG: hypothetical protein VB099_01180 [Candidatus Limiplasma sp.]|nr:hypothetical protein [Candidatus Limiplasma sp.]
MRKLLCLCLALLFCLPALALAETLSLDLTAATVEELEAARSAIDAQLAERQALETSAGSEAAMKVIHYEGKGLSMIPLESFPYYPCRMVFAVDAEGDAKIEVTGGKFDWRQGFTASKGNMSRVYSYDSTNYGADNVSLLVTTAGNWTLDIYPLFETGTTTFAGQGNDVGDLFYLAWAIPVTISYDASNSKSDYLTIELVTPSEYGYLRERLFSESVGEKKGSLDVFIHSNDDRPCFYIVECKPSTTWSIKPK